VKVLCGKGGLPISQSVSAGRAGTEALSTR
jgi:hypothetical protein